jgi:GntR family trehalose operon transcriptional repressor
MSKYKKVYQDIKKKIEDQVWSTGQALPTENELMEIYSYSKDTIRKALSLLEMDGYIQKKQGKSSIVIEHGLMKEQYLAEIKTAGELNKRSKHQIQTELTSLYIVQGQDDLMSTFEVDDKVDFYRVSRVRIDRW